jgi:hypothetical protein
MKNNYHQPIIPAGDGAHLLDGPVPGSSNGRPGPSDEAVMLLQRQNEALLKRLRAADGALEENRQLKQQLQQLVSGRASCCRLWVLAAPS